MKKYLIAAMTLVVITAASIDSHALDFSIGANTWYSWWDFDTDHDDDNMNFKPALLYGPLLSVRFHNEWSVSSVFLYGSYKPEKTGDNGGGPGAIDRYDSDTLLNYSLNRYLKLFAGIKFMGFQWEEKYSDGTHKGFGPGFGIGITAPLTDNLFLLFNLSGLYINAKHKQKIVSMDWDDNYTVSDSTIDAVETGLNSMISLAYYFPEISTSIAVGFRAQYIKIDYKKESPYIRDSNMLFYGVTLSAVYSFAL